MQFIPAMTMGLVLLCLKDEDFFFPDGSWTVTLVLWSLGGYCSWTHVAARLFGQSLALAVAFLICSAATVPEIIIHVHQPLSVVFALETLGTMIEHMAVVYVIMPLLPAPAPQGQGSFFFPKVKPKSDSATKAPPPAAVMHAAITFSTLHWCMWRGFGAEMNPAVTMLLAYLRTEKEVHDPWHHAVISIWGQVVGLVLCIVYTTVYFPRESKMWRLNA